MQGTMGTVSNTETLEEQLRVRSRGYQLEMMEAGMQRNIIVAAGSNNHNETASNVQQMDTGSGKTQMWEGRTEEFF